MRRRSIGDMAVVLAAVHAGDEPGCAGIGSAISTEHEGVSMTTSPS